MFWALVQAFKFTREKDFPKKEIVKSHETANQRRLSYY